MAVTRWLCLLYWNSQKEKESVQEQLQENGRLQIEAKPTKGTIGKEVRMREE